jgi:hypothetical protein
MTIDPRRFFHRAIKPRAQTADIRSGPLPPGSPLMKGVLVVAALIVALMAAIKDGRILRDAGLTGGCSSVMTPRGETGAWKACVEGRLQGAPDLSRQGCTSISRVGKTEYWRCPAQIGSAPGT